MLDLVDRIEERHFAAEATVAPGGWSCCTINFR